MCTTDVEKEIEEYFQKGKEVKKKVIKLWREYLDKVFIKTNEQGDILPNFNFIDNTSEYIDFIIKQLNEIKQDKYLATELVKILHYKRLWQRDIISEIENQHYECAKRVANMHILRKVYKNKKTLKVLSYLYNLQSVYCEKEHKVFDVFEGKYQNVPYWCELHRNQENVQKNEFYKIYYGKTEKTKNAHKKRLERAIKYLIDNESEFMECLRIETDDNGNLAQISNKELGYTNNVKYADVCNQIQEFLLSGEISIPTIRMDKNDTL